MLEMPESFYIANEINETLKGKQIKSLVLRQTPHRFAFFNGEEARFEEMLVGQQIEAAENQGGMIEIDTKDSMIYLSDGASPRYWETPEERPKKHQLMITFEDDSALTCAIQMYAAIGIFPRGACEDGYYVSARTKVSPLSEAFTYDYFKSLYVPGKKKMTVKAFLATEQRIPGLGNGVLQDVLWQAGLDPRCDMKTISEEEMKDLYQSVVTTIKAMCKAGGRNTERDLFGNAGGYITQLCKLSLGKPCPKCGNPIQKANYMGGTVYFCEHCQRK